MAEGMTAEARERSIALAAELTAEIGRLRRNAADAGTELSDAALASAILRLPALKKVTELALAEAEDDVMNRITAIGAVELAKAAEAAVMADRRRIASHVGAFMDGDVAREFLDIIGA